MWTKSISFPNKHVYQYYYHIYPLLIGFCGVSLHYCRLALNLLEEMTSEKCVWKAYCQIGIVKLTIL
jgi:hypothetical protein